MTSVNAVQISKGFKGYISFISVTPSHVRALSLEGNALRTSIELYWYHKISHITMFSSHNPSRQRYTRDVITNLCLHAVKADAETA